LTESPQYPLGPPLLGALMRIPLDAIVARMLAALHAAGFDDLVAAHMAVLRYPGPEDKRPSDLAAETRMSKQAMNYLLGQMEQMGYLVRADDPEDHRSKRIHLTPRGDTAARTMRQTVTEIESELKREMGTKQFGQLRGLLTELNQTPFVSEHQSATRALE
jgi:DNA-binding MarR family transcriptional regulator